MSHPYVVVDAFSDRPLLGNPVAVIFEAGDLDAATMQRIAAELQLSETTFVDDTTTPGEVRVRIFTPVNELPLAGHPLIGTARAWLDRTGHPAARFVTKRGPVEARREAAGSCVMSVTQPAPFVADFDQQDVVLGALGITGTPTPITLYDAGARHLLVQLPTPDELLALVPDQRALAVLEDLAVNCFAVDGAGLMNRMFSPAYGVVEDAATGSACAPLALHAIEHGLLPGDEIVSICQGELLGKGCEMFVDVGAVAGGGAAILSGATAVVASGVLTV
ncbi:PhzF family phenazine biosynthesis protein [Myceligenerans crystallogenes]|uniref:Phenazine biosynthesis protein PhzF n=1 Tax=Myceligenerans crystallogenes TaxID=316335 RepID=A0ABN2N7P3_9MICO